MNTINLSLHLRGNISNNVSERISFFYFQFLLFVGIFIAVENVISIVILSKCTRLSFQIRILSLNLAISDIFTGLFLTLPNGILHEKFQCDIKKYPTFMFINVSLLIITMINLDRCFASAFAMRYYSFITKKLIIRMCVMAWTFGCLLTYGMFFGYNAYFGLSCELIIFSTKNVVNMTFRCIVLGFVLMNLVIFGYLLHYMRNRLIKVHLPQRFFISLRQTRIVRKISVLTGFFLAVFCPFIVIITFPVIDTSSEQGKRVFFITALLVILNSACNPIMYVWRFSEPRYHMKRLLWFWNKQKLLRIDQIYNQETATYDICVISK